MKRKRVTIALYVFFLALFAVATPSLAHVRAGAAFLKMNPGIRHHGMGSATTGVIDDIHSFYANPAATAFIPDWEWATSYSKWFADTGIFSVVYGNNLPRSIDRQTKFALGLHYMDFGSFNSTNESSISSVSAGDALFSMSLARPVTFLSFDFSLGANVKYFNSRLHDVSASSMIYDIGALYKFPKFHDFIVSAGASLTQLGRPLNYISADTPLPQTSRAGISINYHPRDSQIFFQFNTDYIRTKDERDAVHVGGEFNFNNVLYLRTGYQFNENLLSRLTFGAGFRFRAGTASDMRVDAAILEGNEIFSPPLRAGVHHFSVGPDEFSIYATTDSTYFPADHITFSWDNARNRDLFAAFSYFILLARDEHRSFFNKLGKMNADGRAVLAEAQKNENVVVLSFTPDDGVLKHHRNRVFVDHSLFPDTLNYALGDYEWSVVAVDQNGLNYKVADNTENFKITLPDLAIKVKKFVPSDDRCENSSDCCGEIHLTIQNMRDVAARQFYLKLYESDKSAAQLATILVDRERIRNELLAGERSHDAPLIKIKHIGRFGKIDTTVAWTRHSDSIVRSLIGVVDFDPAHEHWTGVLETEEFANNFHVLELPFPDLQVTMLPIAPLQHDVNGILINYNAVIKNRSSFSAQDIRGRIDSKLVLQSESPFLNASGDIRIDSIAEFDSLVLPFSLAASFPNEKIITSSHVSSSMCDAAPFDNTHRDTLVLYDLSIQVARVPALRPKVFFESGGAELSAQSKLLLDSLSLDLNALLAPTDIVRISGHTDIRGDENYNLRISRERAAVVHNYLKNRLNVSTRVSGFGEHYPQETDTTKDLKIVHKINRRIELELFSQDPGNVQTDYLIPDRYRKPALFAQHSIIDTVIVRNNAQYPAHDIKLNVFAFEKLLGFKSSKDVHVATGDATDAFDVKINRLNAEDSITLWYKKTVQNSMQRRTRYVVSDTTAIAADWDYDISNNSVTRQLLVLPALPNMPPEVLDVVISSASTWVGDLLAGEYTYFDAEDDTLYHTTFDIIRGDKVVHSETKSGTTFSYTLPKEDAGSFVALQATPYSHNGRVKGMAKKSKKVGPIIDNQPPMIRSLSVVLANGGDVQNAIVGDVLVAEAHYFDADNDAIDSLKYEWQLRKDGAIVYPNVMQDPARLVIDRSYRGHDIILIVTPFAKTGRIQGEATEPYIVKLSW